MFRAVLSVTFVCAMASVALGKDLCIRLDTNFLGWRAPQLVLKKVKLGPRNVAPLQGYLAAHSSSQNDFDAFFPLYGGSVVNSGGVVAFTVSVGNVIVGPPGVGSGGGIISGDAVPITLLCQPGSDGKINLLDQCSASGSGTIYPTTAQVVECQDGVAIP